MLASGRRITHRCIRSAVSPGFSLARSSFRMQAVWPPHPCAPLLWLYPPSTIAPRAGESVPAAVRRSSFEAGPPSTMDAVPPAGGAVCLEASQPHSLFTSWK